MNVLIAEKDLSLAGAMCELLKARGYTYVWINDVERIPDMLGRSKFDLIITHQGDGPGKRGLDVVEEIRAVSTIPIVVSSGYNIEDEALRLKFVPLLKAWSKEQLFEAIQKATADTPFK